MVVTGSFIDFYPGEADLCIFSRPVPTSCRLCPGYISPAVPSGACAASTSEGSVN